MFIAIINLKTLSIKGYNFGRIELISNKNEYLAGNNYNVDQPFFDLAAINLQLTRGEKMLVLSPGVRQNLNNIANNKDLVIFLKDQFSKGPKNLINEIFFQLKKNSKNDFLMYDASAICIEVDKNVKILV